MALASDNEIEFVVITGSANLSITGYDTNNRLIGNSSDNTITGMGGDDILTGGLAMIR